MNYDYRTIRVRKNEGIATVELNRPEAFNAIDGTLHEELSYIFTDINEDDEIRVAILAGAGRHFCVGGDMSWLQEAADNPAEFEKIARHGQRIVSSMLDCHKPIVARVQGAAVGLGATIALLSDVIFADENATIADPHVRIGLVAGDGGALIWPQLIGYARAKEYLLTGKPIKAIDAERIGLINYALPAKDLDPAIQEFAAVLATGARSAIEGTKRAINVELKLLAGRLMDVSLSLETESNRSNDHKEGMAAFVAKRTPRFGGT